MKYFVIFFILVGFVGVASGQYIGDKLPPGTVYDKQTGWDFPPPLKQIKAGIPLVDVICDEGKVPAYKYNAMRVACVSLDTESKLVLRGWALLRLHMYDYDPSRALCERYEGNWLDAHRECEYISQEQCSLMGGQFSQCESACRHDPSAEICTLQCVMVCSIKGNHFPEFKLTFDKEGGFAGITQSIIIDTQNHLIKISGFDSRTLGPVSPQNMQHLWEIISENKFFELESNTYQPAEGSADYFTYTLDIVTSAKRNTITWTDTSSEAPKGLVYITQEIQRLIELLQDSTETQKNSLQIKIEGQQQVRRGTTHTLEIQVLQNDSPIEGAQVFLDIEDLGEDIIKEFDGYTNSQGYFIFAWEIPQSFDDIETLLAIVDVTDGISSKTVAFKFQVYCLPGEKNCKVEGN